MLVRAWGPVGCGRDAAAEPHSACRELLRHLDCHTFANGGDLASTWVAKPEVHAEVRITS